MTSQVPEPAALEAMMRGALDKVQQVRAASDESDESGPDLGVTAAIGMLAESVLSVLTFLSYGSQQPVDPQPAIGPIFVIAETVERARRVARGVPGHMALSLSSIRDGAGRGFARVSAILVDPAIWPLPDDVAEQLAPYGAEISQFR
jgi:hypothetical protein